MSEPPQFKPASGPESGFVAESASSISGRPVASVGGTRLAVMVGAGSDLLEAHSHIVNALNVFPVPDGDTGTNMSLTMRAVADAARQQVAEGHIKVHEVARAMARRSLMEARGNSGVILSQFFRGLSEGLSDLEDFEARDLANALSAATKRSYGGVGEPVEGTMLTVIAATATEASASAAHDATVTDVLSAVNETVERTVAATQAMLPVLAEAGVVDAGGFGVQLILRGMTLGLAGEPTEGVQVPVPGGAVIDSTVALRSAFLDKADHGGFGFCTQLLVDTGAQGVEPDLSKIRHRVGELANSVVVVGDAELVKIHAHTGEPDVLTAYAETLGNVVDRSAQDMDAQETEFAAGHRAVARPVGSVSFVAVASGEGLIALFADLGACEVIDGGRTKNPSVKDIAEAIDRAPAREVIVIPNDGNVVPAAMQAAELSDKNAGVAATTTIQQGVAAALAFNAEGDVRSNLATMELAYKAIKSGEVTAASRDVTLDGVATIAGQFIGLLDGKLISSGPTLSDVLDAVIEAANVGDDDIVTLFRGEPVSEQEAGTELARISDRFADAEFELVNGDQPYYHYLLSIE